VKASSMSSGALLWAINVWKRGVSLFSADGAARKLTGAGLADGRCPPIATLCLMEPSKLSSTSVPFRLSAPRPSAPSQPTVPESRRSKNCSHRRGDPYHGVILQRAPCARVGAFSAGDCLSCNPLRP
jgi:hypothetical protein